jgi:hypothetical protein
MALSDKVKEATAKTKKGTPAEKSRLEQAASQGRGVRRRARCGRPRADRQGATIARASPITAGVTAGEASTSPHQARQRSGAVAAPWALVRAGSALPCAVL